MNLLSTSNQKGAPSEMASTVINHPRRCLPTACPSHPNHTPYPGPFKTRTAARRSLSCFQPLSELSNCVSESVNDAVPVWTGVPASGLSPSVYSMTGTSAVPVASTRAFACSTTVVRKAESDHNRLKSAMESKVQEHDQKNCHHVSLVLDRPFVPAAHAIHHLFIPIGRPRPKLIRISVGELVQDLQLLGQYLRLFLYSIVQRSRVGDRTLAGQM